MSRVVLSKDTSTRVPRGHGEKDATRKVYETQACLVHLSINTRLGIKTTRIWPELSMNYMYSAVVPLPS